jgi:hypothetical protein
VSERILAQRQPDYRLSHFRAQSGVPCHESDEVALSTIRLARWWYGRRRGGWWAVVVAADCLALIVTEASVVLGHTPAATLPPASMKTQRHMPDIVRRRARTHPEHRLGQRAGAQTDRR